jgi:hypothetical protein
MNQALWLLGVAGCLVAGPIHAADNPDLARRAEITATSETFPGAAAQVADGFVPAAGSRVDRRVWAAAAGQGQPPASLVFSWPEPVTVSTVVYYADTTWGFQAFKEYAIYLDDAETPVGEGSFRNGHGPQAITLPAPASARRLRLEFRSSHGEGKRGGAAEVQIFAAPPEQSDLLCHFTDLSLDYRYAYYPSHNLVRFHLPQPPVDATDWHLALRPQQGGAVLAERSGKLPTAAGGEAMPVPDLPEGDYTLTLTLTGGAETVIEERGIRRDRPEWEGNQLGRDDVVIPPFTPLVVEADGPVVKSVLRRHVHGAAGLWRQVISQDRELLAGPVRIEVSQGGKVHTAEGQPPRITTATPTRVAGQAAWTAGPLSGTTRFAYDYDGLKTITLELAPTETEVDGVQLVIPLRAAEAWLLHPVTTQLRQHYAGRIPALPAGAGPAGRVWDSTQVPDRLDGTFVPYVYLGGPERGISFAADNDRDWITDKATPMMVIEREGDTVLLRLNLVAKRAQLARARTLTFALQATPAKPMPEEPVNWRRWWANTGTDKDVGSVQINFWGGNGYWGGRHFATSVYPDGKDYSFWEKLAEQRRTGKLDKDFAQRWFGRYAALEEKQRQEFEPAMRAGFEWSSFTPANLPETEKFNCVIPYTNARGASGETREFLTTYIDEWLAGDIVDPAWSGRSTFERPRRAHAAFPGFACWYQVEPVPSRSDMLLYYHRKMLDTFADGIYWDNFFLQPNYAPAEAGGPGYVDDDGRPRAGVNLTGFRDLVKRTATMMHVMGRRPLTYIHMTNTNIVPMLSFGTVNLDWEWRDQGQLGSMDLQDRMDLDLILAQSLGLQTGNVSVGITGNILKGGGGVSRDWLHRTGMAVSFPHEIRMHQGTEEVSFVQTQLARFGYGQPDCRVYRSWEEGFPLKTQGAENRALVLARGGKAMIALGNFGPAAAAGAVKPGIQPAGPSLEEYDAQQRGLAKPAGLAEPAGVAPAAGKPRQHAAAYTVRLELDLAALGIAKTAQAWDVELRAGRTKSENARSIKPPAGPDSSLDTSADEDLEFELDEPVPGLLKAVAPGVFEVVIPHHDFALIVVE